jgi:hypothetical protein
VVKKFCTGGVKRRPKIKTIKRRMNAIVFNTIRAIFTPTEYFGAILSFCILTVITKCRPQLILNYLSPVDIYFKKRMWKMLYSKPASSSCA